ncbi:MAG: hypothetical protein V4694_01540 [Pseudomonadota bacterium]
MFKYLSELLTAISMDMDLFNIMLIVNIPFFVAQLMWSRKSLSIYSFIGGILFLYLVCDYAITQIVTSEIPQDLASGNIIGLIGFFSVLISFVIGIMTKSTVLSFKEKEYPFRTSVAVTIAGCFAVYVLMFVVGAVLAVIW